MIPPEHLPNSTAQNETVLPAQDPIFVQQMQRFHLLTVYIRWLIVGFLWFVVFPLSLWNLRSEIALWQDYFTWAALRYALIYNRFPAIGLGLCLGMTLSVLVWQSCNILFGWSRSHRRYVTQQVLRIRQQGKSHPLWTWVCQSPDRS